MAKRGGPKCGGKLHSRDGTCTLPAGWGTDHKGFGRCRKHLGNAPTVAKAAETERLEYELRETLIRLDVQPVEDPLSALQALGGEVLAWKEAIGRKVNDLSSLRYEGVGPASSCGPRSRYTNEPSTGSSACSCRWPG